MRLKDLFCEYKSSCVRATTLLFSKQDQTLILKRYKGLFLRKFILSLPLNSSNPVSEGKSVFPKCFGQEEIKTNRQGTSERERYSQLTNGFHKNISSLSGRLILFIILSIFLDCTE